MDGVRDSKTVDGVKHEYITQGGNVTLERWNDGEEKSLEFIYDNGGAPYSVIYSHGNEVDTYYYILNQQGDVIRIVDTSGKTVAEYTYNGWGEILNVSNAKGSEIGTINPILYRGYYYDSELNMYYLQSRYYDPVMKRMICADDENLILNTSVNNNLFAYCENNPVCKADIEGEIPAVVIGAAIGAGYSAVLQIASNSENGDKLTSGLAGAVISGAVSGAIDTFTPTANIKKITLVANIAMAAVPSGIQWVKDNGKPKKKSDVARMAVSIGVDVGMSKFVSSIPGHPIHKVSRSKSRFKLKAPKKSSTISKESKKAIRTAIGKSKSSLKGIVKSCKAQLKKSHRRIKWEHYLYNTHVTYCINTILSKGKSNIWNWWKKRKKR